MKPKHYRTPTLDMIWHIRIYIERPNTKPYIHAFAYRDLQTLFNFICGYTSQPYDPNDGRALRSYPEEIASRWVAFQKSNPDCTMDLEVTPIELGVSPKARPEQIQKDRQRLASLWSGGVLFFRPLI